MAWKFAPTTGDINSQYSGKLGTSTIAAGTGQLNDKDIGKPVKYGASDCYVLCAAADVPDGFLVSVSDFTQDGYAFGTVQVQGRTKATVVGTTLAVGDYIEAATPAAHLVAETLGYGLVQKHVEASTFAVGNTKRWEVISLLGTNGAEGTVILIERS